MLNQHRFVDSTGGLVTLATGVLRIMEADDDAGELSPRLQRLAGSARRASSAGMARKTRRTSSAAMKARRTSSAAMGQAAKSGRRTSLVEKMVQKKSAWVPTKCSIARDPLDVRSRYLVIDGSDGPVDLRTSRIQEPSSAPEAKGMGFDLILEGSDQMLHILPFHDEATLAFAARLMGSTEGGAAKRATMLTGELWKRRPEKRTRRGSISAFVLAVTKKKGTAAERDPRIWQKRTCTVVIDGTTGHRMLIYTDREDKDPIDLFHVESAVEPSTTPGSTFGDGSFDLVVAGRTFSFAAEQGDVVSMRLASAIRAYSNTCAQVNMVLDGVMRLPAIVVCQTDFVPQSSDELDLHAGSKYAVTRLITEGCNRGEEWWQGEAIPAAAGAHDAALAERSDASAVQQRRNGIFPCSYVNISSQIDDQDLLAAWSGGLFEDIDVAVADLDAKDAKFKQAVADALQGELQALRDGMAELRAGSVKQLEAQRAQTEAAKVAALKAEREKAALQATIDAAAVAAEAAAAARAPPPPTKFSFASSIMSSLGSLSAQEAYKLRVPTNVAEQEVAPTGPAAGSALEAPTGASLAPLGALLPLDAPNASDGPETDTERSAREAKELVELEAVMKAKRASIFAGASLTPLPDLHAATALSSVAEDPEPPPVKTRRPSRAAAFFKKSARMVVGKGTRDKFNEVVDNAKQKVKFAKAKKLKMHIERTEKELKELRDTFEEYDADDSGSLDVDELAKVMRASGIECGREELQAAVFEVDTDGNGTLDFDEFVAVMDGLLSEGSASKMSELFRHVNKLRKVGSIKVKKKKKKTAPPPDAEPNASGPAPLATLASLAPSPGPVPPPSAAAETVAEQSVSTGGGDGKKKPRFLKKKAAPKPKKVRTEKELKQLRKSFNEYDADGSGSVDIEELSAVMKAVGIKVSDDELRAAVAEVDADGNGTLDFEEFVDIMDSMLADGKASALAELFRRRSLKHVGLPTLGAAKKVEANVINTSYQNILGKMKKNKGKSKLKKFARMSIGKKGNLATLLQDKVREKHLEEELAAAQKAEQVAAAAARLDKEQKKKGKTKAPPIDDARIAEWKEHFSEYDHDGGGTVDIEELKAVIASVGIEVSDADLNTALAEVDTDGSGELDFDEFVAMMKSIEEGGGGALGKLVNEVKRRKAHGAVCGEHISADDAKSLVSGGQQNKGDASTAERVLIAKALSGSYAASGAVPGTIDFVINTMKKATFAAGSETKSTLFTAGEAADECYAIVEGTVELVDSKGGTRVVRAGDALGDSALALPCERVETARAQSARVVVFSIDRSTFKLSVGGFAALQDEKSAAVLERVTALTDALTPEQIAQLAPLAEFVVLKGNAVHTVAANSLVCSVTGAADYNGVTLSFLESTGVDALMGDMETPESVATAKKAGAEIMILSRAAVTPVLGSLRKLVEENAAGPSAEALAAVAASAAAAAASGRMVISNPGDIEKLRTLGMGSFGRVFVAKSKSKADAEIFAVKCIKKALVVEMQQTKSVLVEKSVMAECSSPFVVDLVASYQEPHCLCLGMPIQCGGEVAHRLEAAVDDDDEPTGLPPFDAAFYTVGVALGAAHVHSKGFIWRDLKPENVVLGTDGYPRIVDFGLAKKLDLAAGKKAYTMCGTPEYIAPEIVKGTGHGPAADFYALGCFLYECLSGVTPFVRDDEYGLSIYRYVVKNPVVPPEGMAADSPAWLLLSAMLEKDPAKRVGTLKDGVGGIVAHPFIASLVDAAAVRDRSVAAPWKPDAPSGPLDFDHLKPDDEYEEDSEYDEFDGDNAVFAGF